MPHRYIIKRLKRFFIYRVLHVDDTAHRIALGLAIGIFITWTPTLGFQMLLTVLLAALVRANKLVGVPFVWISNPLTAVPLYGFNFLVGAWVLPGSYRFSEFTHAMGEAIKFNGGWLDKLFAWWSATWKIFAPLWVGSILVGLMLGVATYFVTRWGVRVYRDRFHRWQRRHAHRKAVAAAKAAAAAQQAVQPNPASPATAAVPASDGDSKGHHKDE